MTNYQLARDRGELNAKFWDRQQKALEAFDCWTMWEQLLDTEEWTSVKEPGIEEQTGVVGWEKDGRDEDTMDLDIGTSGNQVDIGARVVTDEERLETPLVGRDTVPPHELSVSALMLAKDFGKVRPSSSKATTSSFRMGPHMQIPPLLAVDCLTQTVKSHCPTSHSIWQSFATPHYGNESTDSWLATMSTTNSIYSKQCKSGEPQMQEPGQGEFWRRWGTQTEISLACTPQN